jgi:actin-related protein
MGLVAANIVLVGGNARLPQYKERFLQDIRSYIPDTFPVEVVYIYIYG